MVQSNPSNHFACTYLLGFEMRITLPAVLSPCAPLSPSLSHVLRREKDDGESPKCGLASFYKSYRRNWFRWLYLSMPVFWIVQRSPWKNLEVWGRRNRGANQCMMQTFVCISRGNCTSGTEYKADAHLECEMVA